jgi:hypothetical protein
VPTLLGAIPLLQFAKHSMVEQLAADFLKLLLQLLLLGVVGGGVSWYYSKIQKQRELRISLLKDFASLHGRFLSLRFRFNSFHIEWKGTRSPANHPLTEDEKRKVRWAHFEEACALLGEFYGIKPLLQSHFQEIHDEFELMHGIYQQWRRKIGGDQPVLQDASGKSSDQFKQLRTTYQTAIQRMRRQI